MDLEELKNNPMRYIKSFAMDIVVAVVGVAYIFYQMVTLQTTNENPWILLAKGFVAILCGISIKQALGENGFTKGYKSEIWKEENNLYNEACNSVVDDYIERVDNFKLYLEKEKRMNYRRVHLQAVRLRYSDWFDENGYYIGKHESYRNLTLRQKYMLHKCIRVRIFVLDLLSGSTSVSKQDTRREMTDNIQRGRTLFKNTFSAIAIALVGVYFIPLFDSWDTAKFIASLLQVSMWVLFGVLQLYTNYDFVVQDKVAILRKKKELIARFKKECDKGMYKESPYYIEEQNYHAISC